MRGRRLTEWLRNSGHDAIGIRALGPDPGDRDLLELAESENRVLITLDKDFGDLIHRQGMPHIGLIRLPDVRMAQRIALASTCRYCHQQAGIFQRDHPEYRETHRSGWQEMVSLVTQAATDHSFNEATLRQSLSTIANRSRTTDEDIERALEEGWKQGVAGFSLGSVAL